MSRNVRLYPWFTFFRNLTFWQAVWFLYFQDQLSAADAIMLYAVYDIATTALEVPSGYLSDRIGRRVTLILSLAVVVAGEVFLTIGGVLWVFLAGQILLGAGMALSSGTDSALLYESLQREGRADEIDRQELLAWRCSFAALAVSAVTGGAAALLWDRLPFAATALSSAVALGLALRFREPPRSATDGPPASQLQVLRTCLTRPILAWLFVISMIMYVFSHVPFVFGQPFIQQALQGVGLGGEAPLVSGAITAAMMLVSVATSWIGPVLRRVIGLGLLLCLAFAIQILLSGVMAISNDVLIIAVLLIRMVPDSLSRAFIIARIQPLLPDHARATYLSMQSFVGRLLLAVSLLGFSALTPDDGTLAYGQIQAILVWYVAAGILILAGLILTVRRAGLQDDGTG